MKNWLKNNYVLLTGASGGIGRELTKILITKYGAKVIGIGRSEEKMRSLQKELGENKVNFLYQVFDVGNEEGWQNLSNWLNVKQINPVLLINNAGVFPKFEKALETQTEICEKVMQTNYFSVVYGVKTIAPILKGFGKNKPAVVNISSSAALCSVVGTSSYSASKAAIKGYTESLQMEEKGKKYVGVIYPGTTKSELFREDENTKNGALDKIAMPTHKMSAKIAKTILQKKKRAVLGWDAKLMNITAKIAPVKGLFLIRKAMECSRSKVFSRVFDDWKK